MVRQILEKLAAPVRAVARPISGLHQAAYLLAALTLASQVLALVRDRIFASSFGAGQTLDLYYAAFKIPDVVFALVASLVSAYVLIPRISSLAKEDARELLSQTASFLVVAGGLLCLVIAVAAPNLLFALFPSFATAPQADGFVLLARLLLLQPILLGLSGVLSSVTQIRRRFFLFALSPVLYNIGIIIGTVFLYPIYGLAGVGMGVVIGALAHVSLHIPVVLEAGLFPRLTWPRPSVIWSVMTSSIPRSLALGMGSVITLALTVIAARTGEGSVSVFTLAGNLESVPLALIGASYATAAFPVLAEQHGTGRSKEFAETVGTAARHIIFWSSVITVLTIVLRAHLVRIIYGTGRFDWNDTRLTAAVLGVLILGLLAQGLILLAARAFYAANRSWNPLIVQLADAGISVATAWGGLVLAQNYPVVRFFVEALFRVEDVPGSDILFVAIGAAVGQLIMGAVALATLRVVAPKIAGTLSRPVFEGFGAAILGGAAAYEVLSLFGSLAPLTTTIAVFAQGVLAGIVGLTVAAVVLILLENREFRDLYASLRRLTSRALPSFGPTLNDRTN